MSDCSLLNDPGRVSKIDVVLYSKHAPISEERVQHRRLSA
jgi:hypothetical protein